MGLDVRLGIAEYLESQLGERFAPPQLMRDMVARGELGRKSGKGFFDWPEDRRLAERARYDALLRQGLALLASELPVPEQAQDTP